jgi:hypothetical protein
MPEILMGSNNRVALRFQAGIRIKIIIIIIIGFVIIQIFLKTFEIKIQPIQNPSQNFKIKDLY